MTDQNNAAQAAEQDPLSDEYVNAVIQRHGYQSPETVIARLYQWMGRHGGENGVTLLMYEAHKALVKLRAPVAKPAPEHFKPPFDNCSFRMCDLPGQCRGEGKCHHPASAPVADERAAFNKCHSTIIKALAAIAMADGPDTRREDDPELIYRSPVMDDVVRIRIALDECSAALASAPVADESPMAKMAEALREKARQEQQAYQDRRNQATEWGPMPEGTEADSPTSSAPVAHVAGDEVSRHLEWAKDRSAWEMPVGTPVYYSVLASAPVAGEAVSWQVRRTDGSPLACWESCTKELYDLTKSTGRYSGFENGPPCEVRALGVIDAAPQASAEDVRSSALEEAAKLMDQTLRSNGAALIRGLKRPQAPVVDKSPNLQGSSVDKSTKLQGDKDGGQQRAGDGLPAFMQSRMTPWGLLVRACRIVVDTTLMDMSRELGIRPSSLSAYEHGRKGLNDDFVIEVMRFFEDRGLCIPATAWRKAAIAATQPEQGERDA